MEVRTRDHEAAAEPLEIIESAAATGRPASPPHHEPEPDARPCRGVYTLRIPRQVLCSLLVEIRTAELPRWKPRIAEDRRRAARDDD